MDYILKTLAVLLLIAGVPFFLLLGTITGTLWLTGPPAGSPNEQMHKVFMLYAAFMLAGIVSAAGGILWAVARLAYPPKSKRSELGAVNTTVEK